MSDTDLTRLTVNLTPKAATALEDVARRTGETRTDLTNIAVMLYAQLVELGEHEGVYRATAPDIAGRPLYLKVSRTPWPR